MGVSVAAALLIYIPIAGLIMLANIRERKRMQRLYTKSVFVMREMSVARRRLS